MHFRLELAQLQIGSFRSRQRAGCPRSAKHAKQDRLNVALGHWPEGLKVKRDFVVCSKYRHVQHIPRAQGRHESSVRCLHCKVQLCVHNDRQCFQKYHTLVEFWQ